MAGLGAEEDHRAEVLVVAVPGVVVPVAVGKKSQVDSPTDDSLTSREFFAYN